MITLIIEPAKTPGKFIARLDGEIICQSDQPMVDSARELLRRGHSDALATARHAGSAHDSFTPLLLSAWAQWTFSEGDGYGLRREKYRPRPDSGLLLRGKAQSTPSGESDV